MEILITGGVGSGTTFMAKLMQNMGRDLGEEAEMLNKRNALTQVRGLEHRPLRELLLSWTVRFFPVMQKERSRLDRNLSGLLALDDPLVARKVASDVQRISVGLPQVVKSPLMMRWLGLWLLAGGRRPDHVFVMMRDTTDQILSNLRDDFTIQPNPLADRLDVLADYGFLLETLMRYHIDWSPINFPECVTKPDVIGATLGITQEQRLTYLQIHGQTANAAGILTVAHLQERYRDLMRGDLATAPIPIGPTATAEEEGDEVRFKVNPMGGWITPDKV